MAGNPNQPKCHGVGTELGHDCVSRTGMVVMQKEPYTAALRSDLLD
jgi:hypothetical protein